MTGQTQTNRTATTAFCGGLSQNKLWPNDDQQQQQQQQVWSSAQRPPAFHTGPPPPTAAAAAAAYAAAAAAAANGWQQNVAAPRGNVFPPPARFGNPPFENSAVMGNWVARPMNDSMQPPIPPPSGMPPPPPQRSRLQNVWGAAPAPPTMNNSAVNGMFMPPPPDVDFNIHNGMNQWNQPARTNAGGAVVPVVPKPAFTPSFVNRSPPPGSSFNSYPPISQTDSVCI
ncbi:unnamed protein product [Gongylonema pulchrum]|uniref:Zinc finger MIZ domain-containing protein 1 n=1 Tax=Gongylonema pulchrum TaxID=637853 RepID=A0A183EQE9_9BILA|nr:unnamed protein product [Gongylonema pulchrum]